MGTTTTNPFILASTDSEDNGRDITPAIASEDPIEEEIEDDCVEEDEEEGTPRSRVPSTSSLSKDSEETDGTDEVEK